MINVSMAIDLLEQALPAFGSESAEGQTNSFCYSNNGQYLRS